MKNNKLTLEVKIEDAQVGEAYYIDGIAYADYKVAISYGGHTEELIGTAKLTEKSEDE